MSEDNKNPVELRDEANSLPKVEKTLEIFDIVDPSKITDDWDALIEDENQRILIAGAIGCAK